MLSLSLALKRYLSVVVLGLVLTSPALASEQIYDYHPNSTMALGRGFEPSAIAETKLNCLEFTRKNDIQNGSATNTTFLMRTVATNEQLKRHLGVDFKLDARYLKTSGNTNFNLDQQSNFDGKTLNVLISASSEYGTVSMTEPKLTKYGKKLIENGHHDLFRSECGSHLVTNEVLGIRFGILLTIRNVSSKTSKDLKAGLGLEYKTGAMDLKLKTKLSHLVKQASETSSLEISIYATGSTGVDKLSGLAEVLSSQEGALDKIQKELGKYLKEFSFSSAVPIRFMAKPFGFGFENKYENIWKAHYERKIQRIAKAYRQLDFQVNIVRAIKEGYDLRSLMLTEGETDILFEKMLVAEDYLDKLVELHKSCQYDVYSQTGPDAVNSGEKPIFCNFRRHEVPFITLPEIPSLPVLIDKSSGTNTNELFLSGYGVASYSVIVMQGTSAKVINQGDFEQPEAIAEEEKTIDIEGYWSHVEATVKGDIRGYVILNDYFGRQIVYKFHHAAFPELGGSTAYFNLFMPEGVESSLLSP